MERRQHFWRQDWFLALILLGATLFAYQPAWNGKPIWDDDEHLTKPELRSPHGLVQIWTQVGLTHQYYPLVHTVFWIEHRLWDDAYSGYHLVNILLHVGSALLLVRLLKQLKIPGAWLAGAIFALHPIEVETVAWMSELKNTLSGVFFLSSILIYLRFDRTRKPAACVLALLLFGLGLLCKSVIAVMPAIMLVILWWERGQLRFKRDFLPLIPFFVIGISAGLFTAWVEHSVVGAQGDDFHLSFLERGLVAGRAFWFYLFKLFWPARLTFIYPRWHVSQAVWWQYLFPIGAMALFAVAWSRQRRTRGPLAGLLFFVITLFPALGFLNVFPFVYSFVADHFQYLAGLGIICLTSAGLAELAGKHRRMGAIAGLLLLATLGFLTWQQSRMYRDEEILWRTTLLRDPDSWMAHNNLATGLVNQGRYREAVYHLEQTLAKRPDPAKGHYNLGSALAKAGETDRAIEQYETALRAKPDYAEARYNLGRALLEKGDTAGGMAQYEEVLRLRPNDADAHNNLGAALTQQGRLTEAIGHYRTALGLKGNDAGIEYNLANALAKQGQLDEAISHYQEALRLQPDHVEARYELGSAYLQKNQRDEARAAYEEVLREKPDHVKARINLATMFLQSGDQAKASTQFAKALEAEPQNIIAALQLAWILSTSQNSSLRDGNKALAIAQQANDISDGKNVLVLHSLAAAYAETGQFPEAVRTAEQAIQIAEEEDREHLREILGQELEFYKAGKPYRK